MPEFADIRSVTGTVGALTVVGEFPEARLNDRKMLLRSMVKLGSLTAYSELSRMNQLYALRWEHASLPGSRSSLMFFETVFQGDWEQYLLQLIRTHGIGVDVQAMGVFGYPGTYDLEQFLVFLRDHHCPASHVYAANPWLTPRDIDMFLPPDGSAQEVELTQTRWISMLLPLRSPEVARDIAGGWVDSSPFAIDIVHHARVVVFEIGAMSYLLISALYVADGWGRRPHRMESGRKRAAVLDSQFLEHLISSTNVSPLHELISESCGNTPTRAALLERLFASRIGNAPGDTARWVDWSWLHSPAIIRHFAASDQPIPSIPPETGNSRKTLPGGAWLVPKESKFPSLFGGGNGSS